jgi:hypothetical protein
MLIAGVSDRLRVLDSGGAEFTSRSQGPGLLAMLAEVCVALRDFFTSVQQPI